MKKKPFLSKLPYLFLVVFLIVGIMYILSLHSPDALSLIKIAFVYAILLLVSLFWLIIKIHRLFSFVVYFLPSKYNDLLKLIMDIRDGTKNFYKEKRISSRFQCEMPARILGQNELIKVLDISHTGARIKTTKPLQPRDIVNLSIFLPISPNPAVFKIRIVWVSVPKDLTRSAFFESGIEFLEMSELDKKKIAATIAFLSPVSCSIVP